MNTYLLFLAGVLVGSIISSIIQGIRVTYGTLKIDKSNPQADVYRIYLNDLDILSKKKYIRLKIDANADLSQEQQVLL